MHITDFDIAEYVLHSSGKLRIVNSLDIIERATVDVDREFAKAMVE